jgi:hypothetical protein
MGIGCIQKENTKIDRLRTTKQTCASHTHSLTPFPHSPTHPPTPSLFFPFIHPHPHPITTQHNTTQGEPLANPQAVRAAATRLVDAYGFALSPNFVTVSTVGPSVAAIERCVAVFLFVWGGGVVWL